MRVEGAWIKDEAGRTLILRGVNLGGSSKIPAVPDGSTWRRESFYDWRTVSFVGRPFPLDEADEHFGRLASWGQRFLRLLVSWEAVEHSGPGEYDREYLGYLHALVEAAGRHELAVWVDPHQDVWSRWSGGDGAPAWTLTGAGFKLETLHASGAAFLHQEVGDAFPPMIWPTNYNRLACATMFTLFFGAEEFAPSLRIHGEPAQELLQSRYVAAMSEVARALRGLPNVVGFGPMNEPSLGFIGLEDLSRLERASMRNGLMPTPFEAMCAGSGYHTSCARWVLGMTGERMGGREDLNPTGARAWAEGAECVWKRAGVWDERSGKPMLRRPDHFRASGSLADRYLKPFITRFITEIRRILPQVVFFVEGVPFADLPSWASGEMPGLVNAPHWYDGLTLVTRRYQRLYTVDPQNRRLSLGPRGVRRSFVSHLERRRSEGETAMGGAPSVIGEFGLPFDLNRRAAYRTGDFRRHEMALSAYYDALDANLLGATIWNYSADNDNTRGDHWNGEDLSIFSRDQIRRLATGSMADLDAGARGFLGFCRPYAERIAGTPLHMRFDPRTRRFELRYAPDPTIELPTVIYVPRAQYPGGYTVELSDPKALRAETDEERQRLMVHLTGGAPAGSEARVLLKPRPGAPLT